ncbi:MAG TPA: phospholipase D family protein [Burkholderiaceae bacterium]|nr:phospholipase D family protein [Burkholderiaceae bacterium]
MRIDLADRSPDGDVSPRCFSAAVAARAAAWAFAIALVACASLPEHVERTSSSALADTGDTALGRALAPAAADHPGKTGVHAIPAGRDAFAARLLLARTAQRSLDLQYYIWRPDTSGGLLSKALWDAAERGVRVRLLLDDANTKGLDDALVALNAHPNIEVRLFNPFASRSFRVGDFAADFSRVNRRMHNKSFTADNQVAIVGGRNIGDEYLGADSPVEFADLDVLVAGAVVHDISAEFDAYWNSESAYPVASIIHGAQAATPEQVRAAWTALEGRPESTRYLEAVRDTSLVQQLLAGELALEWVPAHLVNDDPAKVLHPPEQTETHMGPRLEATLGRPLRELELVSPYFVPTEVGTKALRELADRGVQVRVLTNSLAATDVSPVYAGYAKYRADLLRGGGVRLFELKPSAARETKDDDEHRRIGGSSDASLHAKTFGVDRSRIFVGSFNLDPRSARLNTEMGVVLESPHLATRLSEMFDTAFPQSAYEARLTADGSDIEWIEETAAGAVRHASTPGVGAFKLLWIRFLSILPIDWLL